MENGKKKKKVRNFWGDGWGEESGVEIGNCFNLVYVECWFGFKGILLWLWENK